MKVEAWRELVQQHYPTTAQFTQEDGTGNTYGELGDWVAHIGPDMQADIVGVHTEHYASLYLNGEWLEYG